MTGTRTRAVTLAGLLALSLAGCGAQDETSAEPLPSQEASSEAPVEEPSSLETEEPSPEPEEPDLTGLAIGQGITFEGSDGAGSLTVVETQTSTEQLGEYGDPPEKGTFLGVLVTYDCTKGACSYNPFDFTLRDDAGIEYDTSLFNEFEPALSSGELTAGAKATGNVTYDVPPGSYSLEYRANIFDSQVASWSIDVT